MPKAILDISTRPLPTPTHHRLFSNAPAVIQLIQARIWAFRRLADDDRTGEAELDALTAVSLGEVHAARGAVLYLEQLGLVGVVTRGVELMRPVKSRAVILCVYYGDLVGAVDAVGCAVGRFGENIAGGDITGFRVGYALGFQ